MKLPERAACRCLLANGEFATVTATRRPRAGRADVKCSGVPALAERMQQVVRLARHTEPRIDSRDQVVLSLDIDPGTRDWELAAVLADRMVRGLVHLADPCANGWSDQWQLGRIDGHAIDAGAAALRGGPGGLAHLGALTGQPDVADVVSSARAWFPLHSGGINDSLCWVEVSVYPLLAGDVDDDAVAVTVPGLDVTRQLAVRQALLGARDFDRCAPGRWRTTVRFDQQRFQGNSYELALVLADRLARGREYVARGRMIASGSSHDWHTGQVGAVEGMAPKCALIAAVAAPGDRIVLPQAWQATLPAGFSDAVRARGASVACVAQIGIF